MFLSESLGKKLIVTSKKIHKKHLQIKQISKNSFPKKKPLIYQNLTHKSRKYLPW